MVVVGSSSFCGFYLFLLVLVVWRRDVVIVAVVGFVHVFDAVVVVVWQS